MNPSPDGRFPYLPANYSLYPAAGSTNTNSNDVNNPVSDFQNVSYDSKELIEMVDCLKASGLLDDVTLPEKLILDDFCDDLKLPLSERRFSKYAARRMSDFLTRRYSLLPNQAKSNNLTLSQEDKGEGSSNRSRGRSEPEESNKNVSTSSQLNEKVFPYSSSTGLRIDNNIPTILPTLMNNLNPTMGDTSINAELYLAVNERLRRLKQEELQLNLLLQSTTNPFQNNGFIQDRNFDLLDLSQGLDLESQRQLRRMSLLAVAEAIGLPPHDILNLHLNRRDSFYPFIGSTDLTHAFDFSRNMHAGGLNLLSSPPNFRMDPQSSHHQQESWGDTSSSLLDEVDIDAIGSNKSDDQQDQRRGSLDLLGTVAAAASENGGSSHAVDSLNHQDLMAGNVKSAATTVLNVDSPGKILPHKKRQFELGGARNDAEYPEGMKRPSLNLMSEIPRFNSEEMRQAMDNLKQAMIKSQTSQRNIQKWDRQFGLKRSHSMTMTKTTKSRNQVKTMLDKLRATVPPTESG